MPGSNTNTPPKKYPAQVFSHEEISCPHCQRQLEEQEVTCPACGFNLPECLRSFPFAAPPLSLIIDPSQFLPERITKDLKKPYRKLRKCAPQVDICFCFVRLPEGSPLAEFAFWLHNTAPEADASRAWQLLIVGDLNSGQLTLTSGYALEPFLRRELWDRIPEGHPWSAFCGLAGGRKNQQSPPAGHQGRTPPGKIAGAEGYRRTQLGARCPIFHVVSKHPATNTSGIQTGDPKGKGALPLRPLTV